MKVRSLHLTNYRRHRDSLVEFPDGVFALVGHNGSGKSSILEAIGFALFGTQATRTARAQLRHAGAAPGDPVRVVLEMELAGQAVQVMREFRGVNLTAHAGLVVDGKALVTPGANSHAAVTQEVERLLGMDRTAFFTSVVAQQKELSRLTDLTAAERKQLILRMLGIDSLDRAIDEARARRRSAEQRVADLSDSLPDPDALAKALEEQRASQAAAQAKVTEAEAVWASTKTALAEAQKQHAAALKAQEAHDAARRRLDQAMRDAAAATKQAEALQRRVQQAKEAEANAARLAKAAAPRDALAKQVAEARRLADQSAAAARVRTEIQQVEMTLESLAAAAQAGDGSREATVEAGARKALAQAREANAALEARAQQVAEHAQGLSKAEGHASCPLCQQPLEDRLPTLQADLEGQAKSLAEEMDRQAEKLRSLEAALRRATAAVQAWQEAHRKHETAEARRRELTARRDALVRRLPELPDTLPDPAPLEAALREADAAHEQALQARALAEALPGLEREFAEAQESVAACGKETAAAQAAVEAAPSVDLAAAGKSLRAAQDAERTAERVLHEARAALGLTDQATAHAKAAVDEAGRRGKQLDEARRDLRVWTALAGGRDRGLLEQFRGHLVGKIRPAINAEASRLLGRFTDGRYQEMLLDEDYGVFVVEEGVAYALSRFSGGESDLAHLALRLAVSRLLTRRSGAAELRFLALDEVFGSLDRRHRDAVVGALHGLEDLYSQVVLVTHQEDLRDVLDAVLEVRTDGDASTVHFHHG